MTDQSQGAKIPRPVAAFLVAVIVTGILLPAILLYQIRSKLDATIWLFGGLLIALIFGLSIPIALWQRKAKKIARPPWPTISANPHFGNAVENSTVLAGDFTWTPELFNRTVRAWMRFTPAGTRRRRMTVFLATFGLAGAAGGIAGIVAHELGGLALLIASLVLIALAYSERIRPPAGLQAGVQWRASSETLILNCSECERLAWCQSRHMDWQSVRAVLRTPAGFVIWPANTIEALLPNEAFASSDQLESFARLARSGVFNYVATIS